MKLYFNIRLFDGTAGTAAAGATAGEESAADGSGTGDLKNTVYGMKQDAAVEEKPETQTKVTSDTAQAKSEEFKKLIGGEYKDEFTKMTQSIINRRFKETKTLEEHAAKAEPLMKMLAQKYGVESAEPETLIKAIENDNSFYESEAMEKGLSVEQYKKIKQLERENEYFKQAQQRQEQEKKNQEIISKWHTQAEETKQTFPDFDFEAECNNPQFTKLLGAGVDVKTAYRTIHMDDIVSGAMVKTAKTVENKVVNKIKARGSRPTENGIGNAATAANFKSDVSKLTKADRAEIAKRVARGEIISF
ncbi:MAG: hypothetical protein LKJ25_04135 [Clostridia bacterium]|jgi:hypothetical protein|nr:hypothetical protein [Clostridia bacterium]